jgi:hypothetical protein
MFCPKCKRACDVLGTVHLNQLVPAQRMGMRSNYEEQVIDYLETEDAYIYQCPKCRIAFINTEIEIHI